MRLQIIALEQYQVPITFFNIYKALQDLLLETPVHTQPSAFKAKVTFTYATSLAPEGAFLRAELDTADGPWRISGNEVEIGNNYSNHFLPTTSDATTEVTDG